MQDHFLFDSDKKKLRGIGCDTMGDEKNGLALHWTWDKYSKKGKPSQCCYAEVGEGWRVSVIFWHSNYEARVEHVGDQILNYSKDVGDDYEGDILVTRIQAQLKAEQLVIDIWQELEKLVMESGLFQKAAVAKLKGIKL